MQRPHNPALHECLSCTRGNHSVCAICSAWRLVVVWWWSTGSSSHMWPWFDSQCFSLPLFCLIASNTVALLQCFRTVNIFFVIFKCSMNWLFYLQYQSQIWIIALVLIICDPSPLSFRKTSDKVELVVTGPYRLVRHPVYTSLILAIWITPTLVSEIKIVPIFLIITGWNSYLWDYCLGLWCSQSIVHMNINSAKNTLL